MVLCLKIKQARGCTICRVPLNHLQIMPCLPLSSSRKGLAVTILQTAQSPTAYGLPECNKPLQQALTETLCFLHYSISDPTHCCSLFNGPPDLMGICNASKFGVEGIIIGELCWYHPPFLAYHSHWIQHAMITNKNPDRTITNSDLECAGLLLMLLIIELLLPDLTHMSITLCNDNSPSIS